MLSKSFNNFIISAGIGWGNYSQGISVSNPLKFISNRFEDRPGDYEVGNFNIDRYFSGDASIFGSCRTNSIINLLLIWNMTQPTQITL